MLATVLTSMLHVRCSPTTAPARAVEQCRYQTDLKPYLPSHVSPKQCMTSTKKRLQRAPLLTSYHTQVDGGTVHLRNETLFVRNSAGGKGGESISLSPEGSVDYTLPAPPGRWLFIQQGVTFNLDSGGEYSEFPYACPAGVVGGPTPKDQSGPQCSKLWCVLCHCILNPCC